MNEEKSHSVCDEVGTPFCNECHGKTPLEARIAAFRKKSLYNFAPIIDWHNPNPVKNEWVPVEYLKAELLWLRENPPKTDLNRIGEIGEIWWEAFADTFARFLGEGK